MSHDHHKRDGGWKSRKLIYSAATSVVIVGVAILAATVFPAMAPMLPEIYGGLLACLATYSGANFAGRYTMTKYGTPTLPKPEEPKA